MRSLALQTTLCVVFSGVICLAAAGSAQASDSAALFLRDYVSTAVLKGGERLPLFDGTKIRVDFARGKNHDAVRWSADCNFFGAPVEIAERRLVTGQIVGTEQDCGGVAGRQDRWMARFFSSDPKWRIPRAGRLRLTAGDRVIRLRQRK